MLQGAFALTKAKHEAKSLTNKVMQELNHPHGSRR
jgi:hypothetical protein